MQAISDRVNDAGQKFGLKMNTKKTKVMLITKDEIKPKLKNVIDGTSVEQVEKFVKLGPLITGDGKYDAEILRRIESARVTFWKMGNVLTAGRLDLKTMRRLLKCYVSSTLYYGSETWTLTTRFCERIVALRWLYRRMLKIKWTDKITNDEVFRRDGTQRSTYKSHKLRYF